MCDYLLTPDKMREALSKDDSQVLGLAIGLSVWDEICAALDSEWVTDAEFEYIMEHWPAEAGARKNPRP